MNSGPMVECLPNLGKRQRNIMAHTNIENGNSKMWPVGRFFVEKPTIAVLGSDNKMSWRLQSLGILKMGMTKKDKGGSRMYKC